MKRNKIEDNKFDPDMTIHRPIESPYRVYIVLKNVYDDCCNDCDAYDGERARSYMWTEILM